jgi:putative transposase
VDWPTERKRTLIGSEGTALSVSRQCELLGLSRSGYYYEPQGESALNLALMRRLDELYTAHPFYGYRKMLVCLMGEGYAVNKKRVQRLMRAMGLAAVCPGPHTSAPAPGHKIYPYLLRGVKVERVNQVWSTDITYIRLPQGFMYLTAVMDWFSRYVLSWEVSVTLDNAFCCSALERALRRGQPEIFNSDQGSQFTSEAFTGLLLSRDIRISMDGRGRALDNIFVERLWRTVKYEEVYLKEYAGVPDGVASLRDYLCFYNEERPHQALGYRTPATVYQGR